MKNNLTGRAKIQIKAPVNKVWEALTKPEIIKKYFFDTNTKTDWKVGSPIVFEGEYQGKSYHDKGTVLAVEPNKLLKYKYWSSMSGIEDKPENYVPITFELEKQNGYTDLNVIQENIPDEKMKEHSLQNWKMVLDNLKKLLER